MTAVATYPHQMRMVEHHEIAVGGFDAQVVNSMTEAQVADMCAPAFAEAHDWARRQGIEIDAHIRDTRRGGYVEVAYLAVVWDVVVGSGAIRHDPERFTDGGSRFIWSARWRTWLNRFMGMHVCDEIADDARRGDRLAQETIDALNSPRCDEFVAGSHCDLDEGHEGDHQRKGYPLPDEG
ncbi:hypothetical protein SEA_MARIOKART_62 [Gordonia phage Mariokart]|nr:hypothetical protein SEA_MARIOKART_62 [Gordonia phage Mariokart]